MEFLLGSLLFTTGFLGGFIGGFVGFLFFRELAEANQPPVFDGVKEILQQRIEEKK